MAKDKNSFILYTDQRGIFDKLSDEQAGKLIKHIYAYCCDENPESDFVTELAFESIKSALKRDLKKYEARADRSRENGKKGGRPKKPKKPSGLIENPEEPKKPDSVSDSVSDSDILLKKETKEVFNFKKSLIDYGFEHDLVSDWLKVRSKKKATNSKTAFNGFIREVEKTNLDKNKVLTIVVEKSWVGLQADWINNLKLTNEQQSPNVVKSPKYGKYVR